MKIAEVTKREAELIHLRRKKYHMAHLIGSSGEVSALCFAVPRAINLKVALWTIRPEAVTCTACKRKLR